MKKIMRTITLLVLCIALLAGCAANASGGLPVIGAGTSWALRHNGQDIPAGVYIYFQLLAAGDAFRTILDENEGEEEFESPTNMREMLRFTVEGQDAADWINEQAWRDMMRFIAVEQWFDSLGLEIDEHTQEFVDRSTESMWDMDGEFLETNSVARSSVALITLNNSKMNQLFNHLYEGEGERAVPDSVLQDIFVRDYLYVDMYTVSVPESAPEGLPFSDDEFTNEVRRIMQSLVPRLEAGDAFEEVMFDLDLAFDELLGLSEDESEAVMMPPMHFSNFIVIEETDMRPERLERLIAMQVGDAQFIDEGDVFVLVRKLDVLEDDFMFFMNRQFLLHDLKFDDFRDELIRFGEELAGSVAIEINDRAIQRYRPANLQIA